jgi:hypothetical protein
MDEARPAPEEVVSGSSNLFLLWVQRIVCLSISFLGLCVIWTLGGRLYGELKQLRGEWADMRDSEPVGYLGLSGELPEIKPSSCVIEENGRVYLWAGSGVKGQKGWFDVTGTNLPLRSFRFAFGRDRIKTIDQPIYQHPDGEIARRIYPERPVFGLDYKGAVRAYPLTVMAKVEVVNEMVDDEAIAVTYCPLIQRAAVYGRAIDGEALSFGNSGYTYEDAFVLYDRKTDSLWYPRPEGLRAMSGHYAGHVLPVLCEIEQTTWGTWRRRYPHTQVIVGADRSRGIPLPPPSEVVERSF